MTTEVSTEVWTDYIPDDIEGVNPTFPEIKLIQKAVDNIPLSGKHGGDFWLSDSGEFLPTLDGVFIRAQSVRSFWSKDDMKRPVCASLDGRVPTPGGRLWEMEEVETRDTTYEIPHDEPTSCGTCFFSQYNESEGRTPCPIGYVILFELEDGRLFRMRWKGSAATPMRKLINSLAGTGVRRNARTMGRPLFSKRVHIYSDQAKNEKFTWYAPSIDIMSDVEPALAPEYIAFANELRQQFKADVELTHDESEEAVADNGGWQDV